LGLKFAFNATIYDRIKLLARYAREVSLKVIMVLSWIYSVPSSVKSSVKFFMTFRK